MNANLEAIDEIEKAFAREREARRWVMPALEQYSAFAHVFKCVCCGRTRPDEQRREPESEVCLKCVQMAGFDN